MMLRNAATFFMLLIATASSAKAEFVYTNELVSNPANPSERIKIGERAPVSVLKTRFPRYKIVSTAGEDCLYCATITGPSGSIYVALDETGTKITTIMSSDQKASDALGNVAGSRLIDAVGNLATCDNGLYLSCESDRMAGLSYVVKEDAKCPVNPPASEGGKTRIPPCARIGGFAINQPAVR